MNGEDLWRDRVLNEGEWLCARFGGLRIVVLNAWEEWRIARVDDAHGEIAASGSLSDLPADLEWERWDNDPKDSRIAFRPTFPTLPVVARPHSILNLSPKGSATFFVGIPAWIEVMAECQGRLMVLDAFPTVELSKTWHGSRLQGSLGFALRTYARRVFDASEWPEYDIVCSISIVNKGEDMLPFDRLYLKTDHLAVFEEGGRLWANAARINIDAGNSDLSDIIYAERPSKPHDKALEVTPAREGYTRRSTVEAAFSGLLGRFNPLED